MRIIVVGAVAAGTSAAAKARRNMEDAEIVIYEKSKFISYSGCGMPYALGGLVPIEELTPRNPAYFKGKYNVDLLTGHEVLDVDAAAKTLRVKETQTGPEFEDKYDTLILATGAKAFVPPIPGSDLPHVFTLRNMDDAYKIGAFLKQAGPKTAVIVGTGSIGLELAENFAGRNISVTMVEMLPHVSPVLDEDMASYVQTHLEEKGVTVLTGSGVEGIHPGQLTLKGGDSIPGDIVILAAGIRPETTLARKAGVELGDKGSIKVDSAMRTNVPGIYACGDCAENTLLLTGKPAWRPLGSTANKTGRIAGDQATGGDLAFRGVLGTGIFQVFDLTVALTGLSQREAEKEGYDVQVSHDTKVDKAEFMNGQEMTIKGIADKTTGKLLGAQIVGRAGVDKRIDVFATALTFGALAEDLFHLDLAYSPPYSIAKDPVMYTGMILEGAMHRGRKLMTPDSLRQLMDSGKPYQVVDARVTEQYEQGHVPTAQSIPHEKMRQAVAGKALRKDIPTITYCNKGTTGNAAQNILLGKGFQEVYNLSGGHRNYCACHRKKETDSE